jgi:hypothetical protein
MPTPVSLTDGLRFELVALNVLLLRLRRPAKDQPHTEIFRRRIGFSVNERGRG